MTLFDDIVEILRPARLPTIEELYPEPKMQTLQTRTATAMAKTLAWDAARGRHDAAFHAVDSCVRALKLLEEAGADKDDIATLRATMLDTLANVQHGIDTALDEQGLVADQHKVDLSELRL